MAAPFRSVIFCCASFAGNISLFLAFGLLMERGSLRRPLLMHAMQPQGGMAFAARMNASGMADANPRKQHGERDQQNAQPSQTVSHFMSFNFPFSPVQIKLSRNLSN